MPTVTVSPADRDSEFELTSVRSSNRLRMGFVAGPGVLSEWVKGQDDPFLGWISSRNRIVAADSLVSEIPVGSWMLVTWGNGCASADTPLIDDVVLRSSESWTIRYKTDFGPVRVDYEEGNLQRTVNDGQVTSVRLNLGKDERPLLAKMTQKFEALRDKYPKHRYLLPWRLRAMNYLLLLAGVQTTAILVSVFFLRYRLRLLVQIGLCVGWSLLAAWMHLVYFAG
jgi:hypothetical protein